MLPGFAVLVELSVELGMFFTSSYMKPLPTLSSSSKSNGILIHVHLQCWFYVYTHFGVVTNGY